MTSFSADQQQGHLAFSYWFHPPDNSSPDASGLARPYTSQFWPAIWATRVAQLRLSALSDSHPDEDEDGMHSAPGVPPAYHALPVSNLWWRHRFWLASCGRRRHQFLLMRRVRRRTS